MDVAAYTKAMREERMSVIGQLQGILDETAGQPRTAEQEATIARLDARIDEIDAEVRKVVHREQRELDYAGIADVENRLFGEARAAKKAEREVDAVRSFVNSVLSGERAALEVPLLAAAKEREMLRQGASADEVRALAWDATSGSLTVPTTMARSLFQVVEAQIAGFRVGATRLNTSTGENYQLPKLTTHAVATQTSGQGTTFAGTDPVFGRVNLNVFKYNELVKVSNEILSDSAVDIGSFLGEDMGYALSRVIDADLVVGAGSTEPTGMTVLAGAGTNAPITTGGSLIAPTVEKYIDTVYSVNDGYRARGAAWLMKDATAATIRKFRDGAGGTVGAFLWQPSLTQGIITGEPDRFLGYPHYTDPNCAAAGSNATLTTFGWFGAYVLRTVGNPVIESDTSVGFATDEVWFRAKWRIGGAHRDVAALNNLVQNV